MKIDLEEPFRSQWRMGYLVTNPENRRNVILFNNHHDRTTISYARYLMCVKLGYILSNEYEVDHKDDDKTNDDINNLQILTQEQNKIKEENRYRENEQVHYGYYCAYCETPFLLSASQKSSRLSQGTELAFCTRTCSILYNNEVLDVNNLINNELSQNEINRIKDLHRNQKLSSYKISEITGFARNTVMKYW